MVLSLLLMIGVSESAKVNNVIVAIKVSVLAAFIAVGGFIVLSNLPELMATNWTPFIPENTGPGEFGVDGIMRAASIVFFAPRHASGARYKGVPSIVLDHEGGPASPGSISVAREGSNRMLLGLTSPWTRPAR